MNTDETHPAWCAGAPACTAYTADPDLTPTHRSRPLIVDRITDDHGQFRMSAELTTGLPPEPVILLEQFEEPAPVAGEWWREWPAALIYLDQVDGPGVAAALLTLLAAIDPNFPPTGSAA